MKLEKITVKLEINNIIIYRLIKNNNRMQIYNYKKKIIKIVISALIIQKNEIQIYQIYQKLYYYINKFLQ